MMNYKILIVITIVLAAILRVAFLGQFPVHLTNDEASLGYNAYSILKTGRDEHGALLPILFKSFGDWKPGLYVYVTIPSVAMFGLTEFATRLPSAIAGIVAVWLLYKVIYLMFENKRLALLSSIMLAIAPWHLHFSRGAWEANIALTLLLAGIFFFLKARSENKYLLLSSIFFAMTLWAYQSAKMASFLVLLGLAIFYRNELVRFSKKYLFIAVLFGLIVSAPVILPIFSGKGGRIELMSVFTYTRSSEYIQQTIFDQDRVSGIDLSYYLFHSETFSLMRGVLGRYFNHFDGRFLFFEGDWTNPRHSVPDVGYLLYAQIPFFLFGVYCVISRKFSKDTGFILFWLLVAPLPAAFTKDSVHGVRALNMIIPLAILSAYGAEKFLVRLSEVRISTRKYLFNAFVFSATGLFYLASMALYLDAYYVHLPAKNSQYYLYGYKQIVELTKDLKDSYDQIVVQQSYDQAYIYFLFYNQVDPASYQKQVDFLESEIGDVGQVKSLDNIIFRPFDWASDKEKPGVLLIAHEDQFPLYEIYNNPRYKIDRINYLDGSPAFLLVEAQNESL